MKYFSSVGFLVIAILLAAQPVFALTVSPAKLEITGDPGRTVVGEIQLLNEQDETKTFYSSFSNFDAQGESGAPHFTGAADGLASWMEIDPKVTLEKNELTTVHFSINIPKDAEPGGHFAAIFFGTQAPSDNGAGQVAVGGKVGILVLLKVSGEVEQGGGLLDFSTKSGKRFFTVLPVPFEYRVNNTGGDRMVPEGTIKIKNLLVIPSASISANSKGSSVLPDSTRKIEVAWGEDIKNLAGQEPGFFAMAWQELKHFHLGAYSANLSVVLGGAAVPSKKSFIFFVFPWQLLLLLFGILLIVFFVGTFGIKKYNAWIISQVTKQRRR